MTFADDEGEEGAAAPAPRGAGAGSSEGKLEFVGVAIRAKFPNQKEWQELTPLSGGQKSIIALALIFAIQRCDPSPFYLFDEVDDSLDANYKTAVARVIAAQAKKNVQFFLVTFSRQLVEVCDKVYGSRVERKTKESVVDCITREAALKFVAAEEQAMRRVGAVVGEQGGVGVEDGAEEEEEEGEEEEEYDVQVRGQALSLWSEKRNAAQQCAERSGVGREACGPPLGVRRVTPPEWFFSFPFPQGGDGSEAAAGGDEDMEDAGEEEDE